jgi:hypothetical protein
VFECLFSSTFIDIEGLSFKNLVEYYLPSVEYYASVKLKIRKMKIASQDVNIKSGLVVLFSCPKSDFPTIYF